jgi:hypothetical protein
MICVGILYSAIGKLLLPDALEINPGNPSVDYSGLLDG